MNHSRLSSLIVEMAGSAAVCGVAYLTELLIRARRRHQAGLVMVANARSGSQWARSEVIRPSSSTA